jgi:hypothetical protein
MKEITPAEYNNIVDHGYLTISTEAIDNATFYADAFYPNGPDHFTLESNIFNCRTIIHKSTLRKVS